MLYWSKAAVFAAVSVVIALATSLAVFGVGQILLHSTGQSASLSQPGALRAVLLTGFFVALSGAMAYGMGAIVRNTAGGITASFGLMFLVPQLAKALPSAWYADLDRWLPGGDMLPAITSSQSQPLNPHMFSAWGEFAVFGGYAGIMLALSVLRKMERQTLAAEAAAQTAHNTANAALLTALSGVHGHPFLLTELLAGLRNDLPGILSLGTCKVRHVRRDQVAQLADELCAIGGGQPRPRRKRPLRGRHRRVDLRFPTASDLRQHRLSGGIYRLKKFLRRYRRTTDQMLYPHVLCPFTWRTARLRQWYSRAARVHRFRIRPHRPASRSAPPQACPSG